DHAGRSQNRFEENGRDLRTSLGENSLERTRIAEFPEQRPFAVMTKETEFEVVIGSVISVTGHQDEPAAGDMTRHVRREHPGFRPRVAEADPFDRGNSFTQKFASSTWAFERAGHAVP